MQVKVYRNIRAKNYSVLYKGRVIAHLDRLLLQNVTFVVHDSGRQRVLKEKRKNVHAFVVGDLTNSAFGIDATGPDLPAKISYNPYRAGTFQHEGRPIKGAAAVLLNERGMSGAYLEEQR